MLLIFKMRKLHQVIIVIVSVLSLLGFLLYKHEYDRLRNVMSVLNTFGEPSANDSGQSGNKIGEFLKSVPHFGVWQRIGNVDIYSAFWETDYVKVIGVIPPETNVKDVVLTKCLFWYESLVSPVEGLLSIEILDSEDNELVLFICKKTPDKKKDATAKPYAVSLLSENEINSHEYTTLPLIQIQSAHSASAENKTTVALCSIIRSPQVDEILLSQLVKYHYYVGVRRMTFYNLGIAPKIHYRLLQLAHSLQNLNLHVLPWNYPYEIGAPVKSSSSINLIHWDCVLRHLNYNYVLLVNSHQLMVPKSHSHISNFLQDEDEVLKGSKVGRLEFNERIFCLNFPSNSYAEIKGPESLPMFYKTGFIRAPPPANPAVPSELSGSELLRPLLVKPSTVQTMSSKSVPILKKGFESHKISEDLIVLHSYKNCSSNSDNSNDIYKLSKNITYDNLTADKILKSNGGSLSLDQI